MSRKRYHARREAPNCVHRAGDWYAYQAELDARQAEGYSSATKWPEAPEDSGHCEACFRQLWSSREPWPADVWTHLDAQAAESWQPGTKAILKSAPSLPKYQGGRVEGLGKLYARACQTFTDDPASDTYGRCQQAIGQHFGDNYGVVTTNGHGAIVGKGKVSGDRKTLLLAKVSGQPWIELPREFHAALKRVRLFANERTNAITLTAGEFGVVLAASSYESGEASERIDLPGDRKEHTVCLNADYLDAVCGVWPLRWYLAGDRDTTQVFEPAGADWRAVIMPMRV